MNPFDREAKFTVEPRQYLVFVGTTLVAQFKRDTIIPSFGDQFINHSTAYFCPTCGEIWARIIVPGSKFHHPLMHCCSRHWSPLAPSAGLLIAEGVDLEKYWPPEVYSYDLREMAARDFWWQEETQPEGEEDEAFSC